MDGEANPAREDLYLRLYGGPMLLHQGREVGLSPNQARFIALVWVQGTLGLSRARVGWLLWEDDLDSACRHRISELLYQVNHRTVSALVRAEGDHLHPAADVASDIESLRSGDRRNPVAREPFTKLRTPHPTRAFDEWVSTQRTTLRHWAVRHDSEILQAAEEAHDYSLQAEAARAILRFDPPNERALRSLIRAIALEGNALQAVATFEAHAATIRRHRPGWTPSSGTRRLLEGIDTLKQRQTRPATSHDLRHRVPLVGRRAELNQLREWVLGAGNPWQDVIIRGEAGVGKSRLIEELGRQLELEDGVVIQLRAFEAEEGIAFNLLSEIADHHVFRAALSCIAPGWRNVIISALALEEIAAGDFELPDVPLDSASRRVYESLLHLFNALEDRVVLLIDDLPAADLSSLAALAYLRHRVSDSEIRMVSTAREDDLRAPDSGREYLHRLTEQTDHWLDLTDLPVEEAEELVVMAWNQAGDTDISIGTTTIRETDLSTEHIVKLAAGNPLFLIELSHAAAAGAGIPPHGELPDSIDGLVERRFTSLDARTRAFLHVLSAQTGPASLERLAGIAQLGRGDALACLEVASTQRLVTKDLVGIDFRHDLIRRWTYARLSLEEQRFIHRATAERLSSTGGDASPAELAHHYHHASLRSDAFRWSVASVEAAETRAAFPEAIHYLGIAAADAPSESERFRVLSKLGRYQFLQGDLREAAATLNTAVEVGQVHGTWNEVTDARIRAIQAAAEVGLETPEDALNKLEDIKGEATTPDRDGARIRASDLQILISTGMLDPVSARRVFLHTNPPELHARESETCLAWHLFRTFGVAYGEAKDALLASSKALDLVMEEHLNHLLPLALSRYLIVHNRLGQLIRPREHKVLAILANRMEDHRDLKRILNCLSNLGSWYLDTRRFDDAYNIFQRARYLARRMPDPEPIVALVANFGEYYLSVHEPEQAERYFAEVERRMAPIRRDVLLTTNASLGICSLSMGRMGEAMRRYEQLPPVDDLMSLPSIDPTWVATFIVRIMCIRKRADEALTLLGSWRTRLRDLHVTAFLRIGLVELHVQRTSYNACDPGTIEEGTDLAHELQLKELANAFDAFRG